MFGVWNDSKRYMSDWLVSTELPFILTSQICKPLWIVMKLGHELILNFSTDKWTPCLKSTP